jgi:hypothetical protein
MTLDTYADFFDEDLDGVADSLDAAIKLTADALRTARVPQRATHALNCSLTYSMRTRAPGRLVVLAAFAVLGSSRSQRW